MAEGFEKIKAGLEMEMHNIVAKRSQDLADTMSSSIKCKNVEISKDGLKSEIDISLELKESEIEPTFIKIDKVIEKFLES